MCSALRPRKKNGAGVGVASVAAALSAPPREADVTSVQREKYAIGQLHGVTTKQATEENNNSAHWDAFATLQDNYESSDDSSESNSKHSQDEDDEDECSNNEQRWDAFQTLESNYQSSSESDDESCDESYREEPKGFSQGKHAQECIDLLDSDSDTEEPCNKENELVDSDEEPASDVKNLKRRRISKISDHFKPKAHNSREKNSSKISSEPHQSPIVLDDSSIEEEPSYVGGRECDIPPWQRSVPLTASATNQKRSQSSSRSSSSSSSKRILSNNNIRSSSSFACMNNRNDVLGNGLGVNAVSLTSHDKSSDSKKQKSTTASAKSTRTKSTAKRTAKTGTKTRKRKTASTGTSRETTKQPKAKRGRRNYRRKGRSKSANRRSGGTNRSTNAWSARERGIRGRNFSGPSTYMTIGKQESALGNVGGATVSF